MFGLQSQKHVQKRAPRYASLITEVVRRAPQATPRAADLQRGLMRLDEAHAGRLSASHGSCAGWSHETAARLFTLLAHFRKHSRDGRIVPGVLAEAAEIVVAVLGQMRAGCMVVQH